MAWKIRFGREPGVGKDFDPGGEAYFNDVTIDGSGNVTTAGAADYGERYLAVQYNSSGNKTGNTLLF